MIYTCTLNPSIDYVVEVDQLELGELNRARKTAFYPGGKGINVSRVLTRLGVPTTAFGFAGGFTGDYIMHALKEEGIDTKFTTVDEPTRVNVKVKSSVETEINGNGSIVSKEQEQAFFEKLAALKESDYLVLAGSLPPGITSDFYGKIAGKCKEHGVPFIMDTSGEALTNTLHLKPFLIKPNQHELGELFDVEITSVAEAVEYGKKLLARGPENVIVSLGSEGALLINKEGTAYANVPKGELRNSVGAGDSLVAGFLASFTEHGNDLEAFQYGIAAGSATAFSNDLCTKETIDKLLPQINVERWN